MIIDSIGKDYDEKYNGKNSLGDERYEKEKEIIIKNSNYSIGYILGCLKNIDNNYENIFMDYFILYGKSENSIFDSIDSGYFEVSELFEKYYNEKKDLIKDEDSIVKIKLYLDNIFKLYDDLSILSLNGETLEKDDFFYNSYHHILSNLKLILNLYNKIRNYLTQKSYSDEKIKINFENSTLLDGWDLNKEKDNLSIIFRKDNLFYLGIINKKLKNKNVFDEEIFKKFKANNDFYEKMEYKLLPGPNKMLPKVFFSKSRIDEFKPSVDLLKKYYEGCHKKGEKFDLPFCHELIDFFKRSISIHDWKDFDFSFSPTNSYRDISGFYKEVEFQGYKLKFKNIPTAYIEELVNEDKLYLFKIYNKDFSEHSKGRPNLHTMYFKAIFDQLADKDNISYKLNGQAEIFYREASLKLNETVIHKNNEAIKNKNHLNEKKDSTFNYDLIKDRRFTEDKFFFHVPITLNFHNEGNNNLNNIVNTNIQKCEDFYIIGVDRGERHLIYLSLINQKGEIIKQFSLNEIINEHDNNLYKVDYHRLLEEKAGSRDEARKNWKTIKNIKELKAGYLSQVINKIVELMDEYNAIIVLEDLNFGFKNSRIKFEKQVYQKFEKMLIDKLNYLVLKKKGVHEPGGLLNAYQLTNRFESFKTMQKQSGILFYIPAWNTSKIDPTTGFVNLFNLRYENIQKAKDLISKFKDIRYNFVEKYFEFNFDYNDFTNKPYGARNQWCICTYSTRVETFRNTQKNNMWDSREIKLTDEFNDLFCKYNIDVNSLQVDIYSQDSKEFYERLLYLLRLTLQLRNSITGTDIDYMVSPVKNGDGVFFDSRKGYVRWPLDADANGAYNIARKGAMLISQIKLCDEEKLKSIKFSLSNDDWLTYVQSRQ